MSARKKLLTLILALACIAAAAGGSIAYFTTERMTTSTVSAGSVKLRALLLEEKAGQRRAADAQVELLPGESCSRIAAAENIGKANVWVRARVEIIFSPAAGAARTYVLGANGSAEGLDTVRAAGLNEADWTYKDGYWYYGKALAPGETTAPLFTGLRFEGEMNNDYEGSRIGLHVDMQATQSVHNGESALLAGGWPGE